MLTGQAAGAIAALAVRQGVPPRALKPPQVQQALLESGGTLIQRWYADVPWGTELWRATQLLALHQIMDRPGEIERDNAVPLASKARWGVDDAVSEDERNRVLEKLKKLLGDGASLPQASAQATKAGDFAIAIARTLYQTTAP
jgi:hypothetical protein